MNEYRDDDMTAVAIVGMAGRFPGADNVQQLWSNICGGVESIRRFTDDELEIAGVDRSDIDDPSYVKAKPYLADIDSFDAKFFGFTPREAQIMDPQQRIFLETCWNALEDAGCDASRFDGSIGVFGGSAISTYLINNLMGHRNLLEEVGEIQLALGNDKDSLCTRVAYCLGLTGPAAAVQTYCSTSLVAVCQAATSLVSGECDAAIAGGVAISVPQDVGYRYQVGGIASPDGSCRPFDIEARGAPLGNAAAAVVLRRLADAVDSGDHIYAVVRGWAVNNDGDRKVGFTAPGVRGQSAVVAEAIANAGLAADDLGYIEAHGTGTALGDAAEVAALRAVTQGWSGDHLCALGSVKSNLGHLDRAAGVTGLIKAALAVSVGKIPPTLHFSRANPELKLEDSPLYVPTELADWSSPSPRRAGVSAFGIGGTNAHVVVEQPPDHIERSRSSDVGSDTLIVLSGRTAEAAQQRALDLSMYLQGHVDVSLADVASTLQVGRRQLTHRISLVAGDVATAAADLSVPLQLARGTAVQGRPIALMFGGAESDLTIAPELYGTEPVFRAAIDECSELISTRCGYDRVQRSWVATRSMMGNPA